MPPPSNHNPASLVDDGTTGGAAGLVYESSSAGHRGANQRLLASIFELKTMCAAMSWSTFVRLFRSRRLLLSTFDDQAVVFALLALLRGIAGRPTVAFFLRPHDSIQSSTLKQRIKGFGCAWIKRIPHFKLVTFTPFTIEPRFAAVAHFGVHDPQYWDQHDGSALRIPAATEWSVTIAERAAGRRIVVFPGYITGDKGFRFFTDILANNPGLAEQVLFVAAGPVQPESVASTTRFVAAGGLLVDRMLTDAELESLYGFADLIWCCYPPSYDQASGIYGRAIQFNVRVIVRRGSLIARLASSLDCPYEPLDYNDTAEGGRIVMASRPLRHAPSNDHAHVIRSWRENFIQSVGHALGTQENVARPDKRNVSS